MSTDQMTLDDRFPWEEDEDIAPAAAPPAPSGETLASSEVEAPAHEAPAAGPESSAVDGAPESEVEDAAVPAATRPVALKEYYSISEVCDIVGLKPHVLRYWETQFQVLNPSKNRSGNRVYQRKEIKLILLVKHLLYEEKYTVEGAKAKLDQMRRGGRLHETTSRKLDREMIDLLRSELELLRKILTVPSAD